MESSINTRIEAELALRFEDRMDVGLISTGLVSLWQEIDAVLYPSSVNAGLPRFINAVFILPLKPIPG